MHVIKYVIKTKTMTLWLYKLILIQPRPCSLVFREVFSIQMESFTRVRVTKHKI